MFQMSSVSVRSPTRPVSGRVVEETEAQQHEHRRPPGELAYELQAAHTFPPHGAEGQHHGRADDEHKPDGGYRSVLILN